MKTWGGEVQFVVIVDGRPYVQLVSSSDAVVAVGTSGFGGSSSPLQAAARPQALQAAPGRAEVGTAVSAGRSGLASLQGAGSAEVRRLSSADVSWSDGIVVNTGELATADELAQAYALGLPALQPWSAGAVQSQSGAFDYWAETLTF